MNKQELIKKFEERKTIIGNFQGYAVWWEDVKKIFEELNEPQKPVVPKFVAEWIEECKAKEKSLLKSLLYTPEGVNSWVDDSENQDLFARAWLDGYEVEEKKRYIVKVKNVLAGSSCLIHGHNNEWYYGHYYDSRSGVHHTRKELEDAGFGWVFSCDGVEVEEVE